MWMVARQSQTADGNALMSSAAQTRAAVGAGRPQQSQARGTLPNQEDRPDPGGSWVSLQTPGCCNRALEASWSEVIAFIVKRGRFLEFLLHSPARVFISLSPGGNVQATEFNLNSV